jgi:hypothetical protein
MRAQPPVAPKKAIVGLVAVDDIDNLKYKENPKNSSAMLELFKYLVTQEIELVSF